MGRGPLGDGLFELTGPVGQLRVRPAQRFLAFLALGDVPDVALNDFSSVFIVEVADEFHFALFARFGLQRQVFVADEALPQSGKKLTQSQASSLIAAARQITTVVNKTNTTKFSYETAPSRASEVRCRWLAAAHRWLPTPH